jgi:hypothetical protein
MSWGKCGNVWENDVWDDTEDDPENALEEGFSRASEDGILCLYVVLATNLGLSICNKILEPKRYAL